MSTVRRKSTSADSTVYFFCRLLRFDDNEPGRQLKQPPAAFLEADSAEVRVKLVFQFFFPFLCSSMQF